MRSAPDDLATALVGEGVTVANVVYTGAEQASGAFSGGADVVGFEDGILLTSGSAANVIGPNSDGGSSTDNSAVDGGDADLDGLVGASTFDASVLTFDFVPDADMVFFEYVFASDEYNEFVGSAFNDVFAFLVNGDNCALVNGVPVSTNNINLGSNAGLFSTTTSSCPTRRRSTPRWTDSPSC